MGKGRLKMLDITEEILSTKKEQWKIFHLKGGKGNLCVTYKLFPLPEAFYKKLYPYCSWILPNKNGLMVAIIFNKETRIMYGVHALEEGIYLLDDVDGSTCYYRTILGQLDKTLIEYFNSVEQF